MGLKCLLSHNWNGCKCTKCGKIRDEGHDWSTDCQKCSICGQPRSDGHEWAACKCVKCGKDRNTGHDWSKNCERCSVCGSTRVNNHDWSKDCQTCSICGTTTLVEHIWNGCKCTKCGKIRDEGHDWSKDCQKCFVCGKTRSAEHMWNGCKCSICKCTRDEEHEWRGCQCVKCRRHRNTEHDWSKDCTKCVTCGKVRTGGHEWVAYRCVKCGISMICDQYVNYFKNLTPERAANKKTTLGDRSAIMGDGFEFYVGWIPSLVHVIEISDSERGKFLVKTMGGFMRWTDHPKSFYAYATSGVKDGPWIGPDLFDAALRWLTSPNQNVSLAAQTFFRRLGELCGDAAAILKVSPPDKDMLDSSDPELWKEWGRKMHIIEE